VAMKNDMELLVGKFAEDETRVDCRFKLLDFFEWKRYEMVVKNSNLESLANFGSCLVPKILHRCLKEFDLWLSDFRWINPEFFFEGV